MKKVKNTKNCIVLFLKLTGNKILIQMFVRVHKHNHNIIFNT